MFRKNVSGFQYTSLLVTNDNDITVEIKNNFLCYPCLPAYDNIMKAVHM